MAALLADSAPAIPSIDPLPNSSGFLDQRLASEYPINDATVPPSAGSTPIKEPMPDDLKIFFRQPLANENQTYTAGKELTTFEWNSWIIGMSICYDLRFPEIYRGLTAKGSNLMINIANWPIDRLDHWVTLLKARAIENQSYIVGVNRTGTDPNSNYNGRSMAIDPMGSIILDAGEKQGVFSSTIEIEKVSSWRNNFPALKSMQKSIYI